jgi:hypothetical protein
MAASLIRPQGIKSRLAQGAFLSGKALGSFKLPIGIQLTHKWRDMADHEEKHPRVVKERSESQLTGSIAEIEPNRAKVTGIHARLERHQEWR